MNNIPSSSLLSKLINQQENLSLMAERKGKILYEKIKSSISINVSNEDVITLEVPSETKSKKYEVDIFLFEEDEYDDDESLDFDCECDTMKNYKDCKHIYCALQFLIDKHQSTQTMNTPQQKISYIDFDEVPNTIVPIPQTFVVSNLSTLDNELMRHCHYRSVYAKDLFKTVVDKVGDKLLWNFRYIEAKILYTGTIVFDGRFTFDYMCSCGDKIMCKHVQAAFMQANKSYTSKFIHHRNYDIDKQEIFDKLGIDKDSEVGKAVVFKKDYNNNLLYTLPKWFVSQKEDVLKIKDILIHKKAINLDITFVNSSKYEDIGFLFNLKNTQLSIGFELEWFRIELDKKENPMHKKVNSAYSFIEENCKLFPNEIYEGFKELSMQNISLKLKINPYHYNFSAPHNYLKVMDEVSRKEFKLWYLQKVYTLWEPLRIRDTNYCLIQDETFKRSNNKITLSELPYKLSFEFSVDEKYCSLVMKPLLLHDETFFNDKPFTLHSSFVFCNETLYRANDLADIEIVELMPHGFMKFQATNQREVLEAIILPLRQKYPVKIPEQIEYKEIQVVPTMQLLLKEAEENYLILAPQFIYDSEVLEPDALLFTHNYISTDGVILSIQRDKTLEREFIDRILNLHPDFEQQKEQPFFHLHAKAVMYKNWFVHSISTLKKENITVLGINNLKKFKINQNHPKWTMQTSSGIDWFEMNVVIEYGELEIPLSAIRKSLLAGEQYVSLSDGTLGMLPEKWLKQYGLLLKMGELQKDETIRISKIHYTIIDQLYEEIDDDQVRAELDEKKKKLSNIENIKTKSVSKKITAELRNYQTFGLNWLQTLDELGWGACLADDMGLGKTLQTISFLQYVKEKYKKGTHLVVCPTSLIYNWESELKKFAPSLSYHIHYGSDRLLTNKIFKETDIIITTYGMVRSDFEELNALKWHYLILDESQAIKNPIAKITKAVQLLPAINRIVLSGTPLQNNTFDLYAQFQFINRGLLGTGDFFKEEFSNPIDKYNDTEKAEQLRKLIFPFILRRTKEQVATDLPSKTESILWCEMPPKQRRAYEEYKNYYRDQLLERIEKEGMAKSGMYVLEGLLRLRQICDSPVLVKNDKVVTTESTKITELLREVEENIGEHKILVFSQFTEMLALIRKEFDDRKIKYCYLDGSTKATQRKEMVEQFQNNHEYKIFLMSIKAGGVGLNLTSADYVYIVDPWWNPAVEQQAIDRTHRIGQTQKIFSYKMICKNSVEEKIMELQGRKKQLANDLITEDAGFIKKLTKEDVSYLFT